MIQPSRGCEADALAPAQHKRTYNAQHCTRTPMRAPWPITRRGPYPPAQTIPRHSSSFTFSVEAGSTDSFATGLSVLQYFARSSA